MLTAAELRQIRESDEHSNYYSIAWAITTPDRTVRAENLPPKVTTIPLNKHVAHYAETYRTSLDENTLRAILGLDKRSNDISSRDSDIEQHPVDYYVAEKVRRTRDKNSNHVITVEPTLNKTISKRCIEAWFPTDVQNQDPNNPSILLKPYDRKIIQETPALQKTAVFHLLIMLELYGFDCNFQETNDSPSQHTITIKAIDGMDKTHWIKSDSPHYEDITRILRSLCLLGLKNYADAFLAGLQALYTETQRNFSSMMPESNKNAWEQAVGNIPALEAATVPAVNEGDMNIQPKWQEIITSLQAYHAELRKPGVSHTLFPTRNNAKLDAVLNLLTTLIGHSITHDGVAFINPTTEAGRLQNVNLTLANRLYDAAAIARGYISTNGDITFAALHSTMYANLIAIIETQKALASTGTTPISKGLVARA